MHLHWSQWCYADWGSGPFSPRGWELEVTLFKREWRLLGRFVKALNEIQPQDTYMGIEWLIPTTPIAQEGRQDSASSEDIFMARICVHSDATKGERHGLSSSAWKLVALNAVTDPVHWILGGHHYLLQVKLEKMRLIYTLAVLHWPGETIRIGQHGWSSALFLYLPNYSIQDGLILLLLTLV